MREGRVLRRTVMGRPKKQVEAPKEEAPIVPRRDAKAIAAITILVVAAIALACYELSTGQMYVKVDTQDDVGNASVMAVVYQGDVSSKLEKGDLASCGQALAAVGVEPGQEVFVEGRWFGTYTVAVLDMDGKIDPRGTCAVTTVGRGETHVSIMLSARS